MTKLSLKQKVASALIGLALLLTGWATSLLSSGSPILGAANEFNSMASSSALLIGTTSTLVTATTSGRQYLAIVNDGSNVVYLSFGDRPAATYEGVRLNANGGTFEITDENLYKGAIRAITASGNSTTTFVEAY